MARSTAAWWIRRSSRRRFSPPPELRNRPPRRRTCSSNCWGNSTRSDTNGWEYVASTVWPDGRCSSLILITLAWTVSGWGSSLVRAALDRIKFDETLSIFISKLVRWVILLLAGLTCLSYFGVETTSFAALIGAAGLAIGLAFQGTLSNFAAGAMLLIFRPYKVGDEVNVAGYTGTVREIELFTTAIDTPDYRRIIVPNSSIFGAVIENVTHHPVRRFTVGVGTAYSADIDETRRVLERAVRSVVQVAATPAPAVVLLELGRFERQLDRPGLGQARGLRRREAGRHSGGEDRARRVGHRDSVPAVGSASRPAGSGNGPPGRVSEPERLARGRPLFSAKRCAHNRRMDVINLADAAPFTTKDGSEIRELLAHRNSAIRNQSLAEARLPPGSGDGGPFPSAGGGDLLSPGRPGPPADRGRTSRRRARRRGGDSAGLRHQITNTGERTLRFLCCCALRMSMTIPLWWTTGRRRAGAETPRLASSPHQKSYILNHKSFAVSYESSS